MSRTSLIDEGAREIARLGNFKPERAREILFRLRHELTESRAPLAMGES